MVPAGPSLGIPGCPLLEGCAAAPSLLEAAAEEAENRNATE